MALELIRDGSDIEATDAEGATPLHYAAEWGSVEGVTALLDRGARVDARRLDKATPLILACDGTQPQIADMLLQKGADINARSASGNSCLSNAATAGRLDIVRIALSHRADPNQMKKGNWTPLHVAAQGGHTPVVKALVDAGADVNARGYGMQTPYDLAVVYGRMETAFALLGAGARPHVQSSELLAGLPYRNALAYVSAAEYAETTGNTARSIEYYGKAAEHASNAAREFEGMTGEVGKAIGQNVLIMVFASLAGGTVLVPQWNVAQFWKREGTAREFAERATTLERMSRDKIRTLQEMRH